MMDSLTPPALLAPEPVRALEHARAAQSGFLAIGIVGAVGAGTSWTGRVLCRLLGREGVRAAIVTARQGLAAASGGAWAAAEALAATDPIGAARALQVLGDALRARHDHAFIASAMIAQIAGLRAEGGAAAAPAVVVCDSLRHPAEAHLLRMVYGDAFWLLGTVCDLETRLRRLARKFALPDGTPPDPAAIRDHAERDQDSPERHGQHVAGTFEMADHFVDTSPPLSDPEAPEEELEAWPVTAELRRFLDLLRGDRRMLRPTNAEQAMYHAYAARLGSACLSRQVGAALVDRHGQLLATGCNEVPRAGGGLYGQGGGDGEEEAAERERGRCHALNGYCSNTVEQNRIIDDVLRSYVPH